MEDSGTDSRIKSRPFGAERVAFPAKTKPVRGFRVDFCRKWAANRFYVKKNADICTVKSEKGLNPAPRTAQIRL